jgi:hypothetical protein
MIVLSKYVPSQKCFVDKSAKIIHNLKFPAVLTVVEHGTSSLLSLPVTSNRSSIAGNLPFSEVFSRDAAKSKTNQGLVIDSQGDPRM